MKSPSITLPLLAASCICSLGFPSGATAEVVASWMFDKNEAIDGGSEFMFDLARSGATDRSKLSETARVVPQATGISDKWKAFLASGYLEAEAGGKVPETGIDDINKYGMYTVPSSPGAKDARYSSFFGFSGLGSAGNAGGGAIFLVLSPTAEFSPSARYGFFGTGHTGTGEVQLGMEKGELQLRVGGKDPGKATAKLEPVFAPGSWYFIAASWQGGTAPVLYVREMAAGGPTASPAAVIATASESAPEGASGPDYDPLAVGAAWFDPGDKPSTVYGSGSRIAYARIDNTFFSKDDIDAVFASLAAE